MNRYAKVWSVLVAVTCFLLCSCSRFFAVQGPDPGQLLQMARQYGRDYHPAKDLSFDQNPSSPSPKLEDEASYRREIAADFNEWDFAKLENEIREARASRERLVGGVWKVFLFYEVVSNPATQGGWPTHFEVLKQWKAAQPNSAAAQIALAESYANYAWSIRGSGTADTVSGSRWMGFSDYLAEAAKALAEAAKLQEKCPYWYEALQQVALGQGWSKAQARELFEQAVAFEPTYYHYDREYAYYLLPKWYGSEGESKAFGAEIADRVGGQQGDYLYFEVASVNVCSCESDKPSMENLSWPRIQSGYRALKQLYGVSDLKANRYALMAYAEDDKTAAREAFAIVGDDRSDGVWRNQAHFEDVKTWALSQ
jgi:hypothetical protein